MTHCTCRQVCRCAGRCAGTPSTPDSRQLPPIAAGADRRQSLVTVGLLTCILERRCIRLLRARRVALLVLGDPVLTAETDRAIDEVLAVAHRLDELPDSAEVPRELRQAAREVLR